MSEWEKNRQVLEDEVSRQSIIKIWEDLGETSICKIQGYSMSPVIRPGDEILVRYGHRNVKKGDIVFFGKDNHSVAHRVVGINYKNSVKTFFCKGDMCSGFDTPLREHDILGRAIEISGSNGLINMESTYWRCINRAAAWLSSITGRINTRESFFWKVLRWASGPKRFFIPESYSPERILLWAAGRVNHRFRPCRQEDFEGLDVKKG